VNFFKKKPEETAPAESIDAAYIDKLLTGDKKIPVAPKREKSTTKPLPFMPFFAAICLLLALLSFFFSLYFRRRLDALTTDPTQTTTTAPTTASTTAPATHPPTEPPTEPPELPLHFVVKTDGEIAYLMPNKTLYLSLRQYYCTSPSLPIPEDDAPKEDWLLLFYSMLT